MMKKIIISILVLIGFLFAENSYYSQNGFGLTGNAISVRSQGIGNTGGAILDSISLTSENPAFWYKFQTTSLQGYLDASSSEAADVDGKYNGSELGGFAMKFPVGEYVGVAFGLKPEFRSNFETTFLQEHKFDGDTIDFMHHSKNKGGISEAFLGFGYKLGSRLSLGLKTKVMFGNYNFTNNIDKSDDGDIDVEYHEKLKMSGFQSEFGLGWNQKDNFAVGLSYSFHHNFQYRSLYYHKFQFYQNFKLDSSTVNKKVTMPGKFTLSLQKKLLKQLYFTSDFYYLEDYSDLVEKVEFFNQIKSDKSYFVGFGLERTHGQKIEKQMWKNLDYRIGAFYKTEPFYKNSDLIKDIGVSAGLGIPLNFSQTMIDVSFQYISRTGFLEDEIGKESIYKFSFGITTGGLWFRR